jgi:hypothetical protein
MQDIAHQKQAAMFRQHAGTGLDVVAAPASLVSSPSLPGGARREHGLYPIAYQDLTLQDIDLSLKQPDLNAPIEATVVYGTSTHHQTRVGAHR